MIIPFLSMYYCIRSLINNTEIILFETKTASVPELRPLTIIAPPSSPPSLVLSEPSPLPIFKVYKWLNFSIHKKIATINLIKVEKILEGCLDLIPTPLPSVKIQIMGGKTRKSGVRIPAPEGKKKLSYFFSFSNSPYKTAYLCF